MSNNTGGYNAGSIYVDLQLKIGDFEKQISDLEKKVKSLQNTENNLKNQQEAINKSMSDGSIDKASKSYKQLEEKLKRIGNQLAINANQQKLYNEQINSIKPQLVNTQNKLAQEQLKQEQEKQKAILQTAQIEKDRVKTTQQTTQDAYESARIQIDALRQVAQQAGITSQQINSLYGQLKSLYTQSLNTTLKQNAQTQSLTQQTSANNANTKSIQQASNTLANYNNQQQQYANMIQQLIPLIQQQAQAVQQQTTLQQRLNSQFTSLKDSMSYPLSSINKLVNGFNMLRIAIMGVMAQKLYDFFIESGAALETTVASFEVLLQSYEKASILTDELIEMAARTPLVTSDLTEGAKRLLAVGVELEDVNSTLEMLGDLAMGDSVKLNRLINAFGKIQTAGRGTLEYLNYFTEAGVPVIEALADTLGVTTEEFFKLSRAGKVTSEQVNTALKSLTVEGGKFYGMMEKQSKTYSGLMSTLQDNLQIIGREIGTEAFEQLKDYITEMLEAIQQMEETGQLDEMAKKWGGAIADLVKNVADVVSFLYEFRDVIGGVIAALAGSSVFKFATAKVLALGAALTSASSSAALFKTAISGIGAALGFAIVNFSLMKNEVEASIEALTESSDAIREQEENYRKNLETVERNYELSNKYLDTISRITSVQNIDAKSKNEVLEAVRKLNAIYPDLNIQYNEEANTINRTVQSLREYIDLVQQKSRIELNLEVVSNVESDIAKLEIENAELLARAYKIAEGINRGDYGMFEEIAKKGELESIRNQIKANEDLIATKKDIAKAYSDYTDDLIDSNNKLEENIKNLVEAMKTEVEKAQEAASKNEEFISSQNKIWESMSEGIEDTVDSLSDLSSILTKEGDSLKLTKDEALKLIETYPELATKIKTTAEGYEIERIAIEDLIQAQINSERVMIKAEKTKTQQAINEALARINSYNLEISKIYNLSQAYKALNELGRMESKKGYLTDEETAVKSYINNVLIPLYKAEEEYNKKEAEFLKMLKIAGSTHGIDDGKTGETDDEREIRNLKYKLDMEYITQKEYYDKLETIRDKYYSSGTKQWQQYTLEITKGRKKMQEENAKAELQAYEDRLKNSYGWIEEEQFYSRLSDDETIAAYERIRAYTKEYYEQGKIDFKRYVEEIKKLDKEIYSIQKENLQDSNKELSDLRKKRYDDAVKQIEDYYDELERAEEEYERQKELGELQTLASLYEGAVTKTGKQKYNELQDEIEQLTKESEKASREAQKEADLKKLEQIYNDLEETQTAYFDTVLNYSEEVTSKIQEMTRMVNESFSNIDSIIGGSMAAQNNNVVYNQTLNQTNNITDKASGQAVIDLTAVAYRYGLGG